jgi:hypothetical protein
MGFNADRELTVGGSLNVLGKIRNGNNESLLDLLEYLLVLVVGDKSDTETLGTETSGSTDSVQVGVSVRGSVLKA